MLYHVRVENIALIDESQMDLGEGLNVITGETGAGKSVLLGAINLALGSRAGKGLVRELGKKAQVILLFQEEEPRVLKKLAEMEIPASDGEIALMRRFLENGKSVCYINDQIVTSARLKELAGLLIDIHGQHEHQSLLDQGKHIDLLDRFIPGIDKDLETMATLYQKSLSLKERIRHYEENGRDRQRLMDLMAYEIREIDEVSWKEGEEEELKAERKRLMHAERLQHSSARACAALLEDEGYEKSALTKLEEALAHIRQASHLDPDFFEPYETTLAEQTAVLSDLGHALSGYAANIEEDSARLAAVEERYDQIMKLTQKYGDSREKVLAYLAHAREELEALSHLEQTLETLRAEEKAWMQQMETLAASLHQRRETAARELKKAITQVLKGLEFDDPLFQIDMEKRPIGPKGWDQVTFCIRTNVGEEIHPLTKIASGGEMSRVMLAIKTVLARQDEIGTLIFDEIDTGISGRTAQSVAQRMYEIGRFHQVICVTHLPQIAAMADENLHIEKQVLEGRTATQVQELQGEAVTRELARMLGGTKITETVLKSAAEMKALAEEWKKSRVS